MQRCDNAKMLASIEGEEVGRSLAAQLSGVC